MFLITAAVYMCGAIAYGLMASGERQEWSKIEGEDTRCEKVGILLKTLPRLGEYEGGNELNSNNLEAISRDLRILSHLVVRLTLNGLCKASS